MDISYISGFFDADGYVTIGKINPTDIAKSPTVGFTNTYISILEEIKNYFDSIGIKGSISSKTSKKENHARGYDLKYRRDSALKVANLLKSFHPKKKHRLFLLLSDYKSVVKRNGKYTSDQLKELSEFESKFFTQFPE